MKEETEDIAWFRADLGEHPSFVAPPGKKQESFVVVSKYGPQKFLKINDELEDVDAKMEELFFDIIDVTGDEFVFESTCKYIALEDSPYIDEVVYFGPGEALEESGDAFQITTAAIREVYNPLE